MALATVRFKQICDSLFENKKATSEQIRRVGEAVAARTLNTVAYNAMSQEEKAQYVIDWVKRQLLDALKAHESTLAVQNAQQTTNAAVDAEFEG